MTASKFSPEYVRYLNSVHWKGVRSQALQKYGRRCAGCMTSDAIHLHHLFYPKSLFDSKPDHLLPLCEACHGLAHEQKLFHPTVFDESKCAEKRRQTIRYIQDRIARLRTLGRIGKITIKPGDVPPWNLKSSPPVTQLPARYGPRKTKSRRYISVTDQTYVEKLYR